MHGCNQAFLELWDSRRIQNLCQFLEEVYDLKGRWDGGKDVLPKSSKKILLLLSFIFSFKIECLLCAWHSQNPFP